MNIVIPMAGEGRRFAEAGYTQPKPLIDVAGKPMIQRVIDCLAQPDDTVTLISRIELNLTGVTNVRLDEPTQGAADTLLHAPLDSGPVLVANCDQYLQVDMAGFLAEVDDCDAGIMVFNSTNPHHSYVRCSGRWVTDIAEKQVISDQAVVGVYWFARGDVLAAYAAKTVATAERVNGEFYISAILALMLRDGFNIGIYEVDVKAKHMLGTPEELRIFLDKVEDGRVVL